MIKFHFPKKRPVLPETLKIPAPLFEAKKASENGVSVSQKSEPTIFET